MSQVEVIGSRRVSAGVGATVRRVREALATAGPSPTGPSATAPRIVVDPGAWYAGLSATPPVADLARTVGFSVSAYGSQSLADDADVGRALAALVHPDPTAVAHLRRLGCRAHHVPLGCRPRAAITDGDDAPATLLTVGPATPRRLRVLAQGADCLQDLDCVHLFTEPAGPGHGTAPEPGDPFPAARVFLDVGAHDDAALDLTVLLAAVEAGAAFVTERAGDWPDAVAGHLVHASHHTLFARARDLARDPGTAAALAAGAHASLVTATSLAAMGAALADVLDEAVRARPAPASPAPDLRPDAAPPGPGPTVPERLEHERVQTDAAVRDGVRRTLAAVRALERRVERLEHGAAPPEDAVLHNGTPPDDVRVSVLIPAFRAARLIPEALTSVAVAAAKPGAPALEVVVVDDASPLHDGAIASAWAAEHPEVPVTVLRHGVNRGLAAARNTAAQRAAGTFVLPLDADNLLRPRGLTRLLAATDARPDADLAYGILQEFDTTGPTGLRGLYPWDPQRLRHGNYIDALSLIRRRTLLDAGGYAVDMPEQGYEDWDLWCRLAARDAVAVWVPDVVAAYRMRADAMSVALHLSHTASLADMLERHPVLLG